MNRQIDKSTIEINHFITYVYNVHAFKCPHNRQIVHNLIGGFFFSFWLFLFEILLIFSIKFDYKQAYTLHTSTLTYILWSSFVFRSIVHAYGLRILGNSVCRSIELKKKEEDTYTLEVSMCWSSWKSAPFHPYNARIKHSTNTHATRETKIFFWIICTNLTNLESFNFTLDSMTENPPFSSSTCTHTRRKKN